MRQPLRIALAAVLLVTLVAGGAGTAAADPATSVTDSCVTVINDHDLVDLDDNLNNITANVLGTQTDDSATVVS